MTFGWPMGVVLDGVEDSMPSPRRDGISAVIGRDDKATWNGRSAGDYWKLGTNGDFYLLRNIFEDSRDDSAIFIDTRVVQISEALQFCRNLYTALNVRNGSSVTLSVCHSGLKGRRLSAASPERRAMLLPFKRIIAEDVLDHQVTFAHPTSDETIIVLCKELLEPLFMMFNYYKVPDDWYSEIASDFLKGKIR
jgi:hypothetical protein